jgi:hypothetical protein
MSKVPNVPENYDAVRSEITELLQAARRVAARNINSLMTATYWEIGRRIVQYEQKGEARADYGQQLVEQLANDLSRQFRRGFRRANLCKCARSIASGPSERFSRHRLENR